MITIDPYIENGRPMIEGTHTSAQAVLDFLGSGDAAEDLLEASPPLRREDVLTCSQYASRLAGHHVAIEKVS